MMTVDVSGPRPGPENMDADVRSAQDCLRGRVHPHLRLYGWQPAAISLGAHQSVDMLRSGYAAMHGVDVVTRPTGGGAILHTDELTYCVTLPLLGRTPSAVYAIIVSAILRGLRSLGVGADAERWPTPSSPNGAYAAQPVCFSGIARDEVRVNGRKLVGSAQRIYGGGNGDRVILQHGSILLSDAHALLPVYLKGNMQGSAAQQVRDLRARSTSLEAERGRRVPWNEAAEAMHSAFRSTPALWEIEAGHHQEQEVRA